MRNGSSAPIGVLLAQLGSPEAPEPGAVRRYLAEFLSDRHIIDYPRVVWWPILHGVILRTRPARSARLYRRIWMPDGSPLLVYSARAASALQRSLGQGYAVALGMRYGAPSLGAALEALAQVRVQRLIVLPLFPQASSTTTGSIEETVMRLLSSSRSPHSPQLATRFIPSYFDSPGYLEALTATVDEHLARQPAKPEMTVMSFHGIPRRYTRGGDPYVAQCHDTARRLADMLGLRSDQWCLSFQSRFGPEAWVAPDTQSVIRQAARSGIRRLAVVAPGFAADCLETLSELAMEGREDFVSAGGAAEGYSVVPCLNDHPRWIEALTSIVRHHANEGSTSSSALHPAMHRQH